MITHDLGVIAETAHRVVVMYAGKVVEIADVKTLFATPRHPYTLGLLESIPSVDDRHQERLASIVGLPPDLLQEPTSCPFAPRCPFRIEKCFEENPKLEPVGPNHLVACWRWEDIGDDTKFSEAMDTLAEAAA